ncbi:MAG: YeeE/YedE thiosulfate transporter family protein, partial [Armatimonadota bacterium]
GIGGLISAALAGTFPFGWVPTNWAHAFGDAVSVRLVVAFVGGILMGIGSRWAGGCTSGHGISGTLQLVVTSWIAVLCFFVGGIASAMLLFRVIGAA